MIETAQLAGISASETTLSAEVPPVAPRRKRVAKKAAVPAAKKTRRKFTTITVGEGESEVRLRFPEGTPLPIGVRKASAREMRLHPEGCPGGFRLVYPWGPETDPKNPPTQARFLATRDERRAWKATLPDGPAIDNVVVEKQAVQPQPAPEQWFRIVLSDEAMEAGGWEFFPDGWCCKMIPTTTTPYEATLRYIDGEASFDPDWLYVQLPYHYFVTMVDENGRETLNYRTDGAGARKPAEDGSHWGYMAVECGMWMPKSILKPVTNDEAAEIFEQIESVVR